jgi:hypothetical protein
MKRITFDFTIALAFIVLSIVGLTVSLQLPFNSPVAASAGPGTFPTAYLVIILVSSVALAVKEYKKALSASGTTKRWIEKEDLKRILILLGMLIIYIAVLELIGFYVIATTILIIGLLWLFEYRNKVVFPIVAIGFPVLMHLFFEVFLKILLP